MNANDAAMPAALMELFRRTLGGRPEEITPVGAHASPRKLFRATWKDGSYIGVVHSDHAENRAFIAFTRHFERLGLPVPHIYAVAQNLDAYITSDLGEETLYDALCAQRTAAAPFPLDVAALYEQAVGWLPRFQVEAGSSVDWSSAVEQGPFGSAVILKDLHHFRDRFLNNVGLKYTAEKLETDFRAVADRLGSAETKYFMYRDFQARNIMVRPEGLAFIDYQSGRPGPLQYDVASLLYQSQAGIPEGERRRLVGVYLEKLSAYVQVDEEEFRELFFGFVFIRLLQVLGAYGRMGLEGGKTYFLDGIPAVLANLRGIVQAHGLPVKAPELEQILSALWSYDEKERRCRVS